MGGGGGSPRELLPGQCLLWALGPGGAPPLVSGALNLVSGWKGPFREDEGAGDRLQVKIPLDAVETM